MCSTRSLRTPGPCGTASGCAVRHASTSSSPRTTSRTCWRSTPRRHVPRQQHRGGSGDGRTHAHGRRIGHAPRGSGPPAIRCPPSRSRVRQHHTGSGGCRLAVGARRCAARPRCPHVRTAHRPRRVGSTRSLAVGDRIEWSNRACGLASLRMILLAYGHEAPTVTELLKLAVKNEVLPPRGALHAGIANLATNLGVPSAAGPVPVEELLTRLGEAPLIVSVTEQFPDDGRTGGHLVILRGYEDGPDPTIHFRDPSAWGQRHDRVPLSRVPPFLHQPRNHLRTPQSPRRVLMTEADGDTTEAAGSRRIAVLGENAGAGRRGRRRPPQGRAHGSRERRRSPRRSRRRYGQATGPLGRSGRSSGHRAGRRQRHSCHLPRIHPPPRRRRTRQSVPRRSAPADRASPHRQAVTGL